MPSMRHGYGAYWRVLEIAQSAVILAEAESMTVTAIVAAAAAVVVVVVAAAVNLAVEEFLKPLPAEAAAAAILMIQSGISYEHCVRIVA